MRLELTQPNGHYPLKVACLPISPPPRYKVPRPGIEPGWIAPLVFETSASTDSAIWAGKIGAKDGARTRDPDLGKVVLYQLSYFRKNN